MLGQPLLDAHQIGMGETGNETWARNVVSALEADGGPEVNYAVTADGHGLLPVPAERIYQVAGSSARRLLWDLPKQVRRSQASVLVAQYTLPPLSRVPGVVVVHDVSFVLPQARAWIPPATLARYKLTIGTSIRHARAIVVPTRYTRDQLLTNFSVDAERVLVAPLALDAGLPQVSTASTTNRSPVVLCVGTVLPRKNLPLVARAVALLRDQGTEVRLRLVGPVRSTGEPDLATMRSCLGSALEVVGPVSPAQLAQEYNDAAVFAYPSLHEGFGLPLLEAMASGLPVVSSNATCLPEVAGDAAQLVDPSDVSGWAEALARALADPSPWIVRGRIRSSEFSWRNTATVLREAMGVAIS